MNWDYWRDLEKDFGGLRFECGGRATDFTQVSGALRQFVKTWFPLNGVPDHLVGHLNHLEIVCGMAEKAYDICIDKLIAHCEEKMKEIEKERKDGTSST